MSDERDYFGVLLDALLEVAPPHASLQVLGLFEDDADLPYFIDAMDYMVTAVELEENVDRDTAADLVWRRLTRRFKGNVVLAYREVARAYKVQYTLLDYYRVSPE